MLQKKTGNYIITELNKLPDERHFNAFNMVFLRDLAEASGDVTYSNYVAKKMNDLFTKVTTHPNGNLSTDGQPGLTAAELVAAEEVIRGTSVWGIKPWDLYHWADLANDAGNSNYAMQVANGIKNYVEQVGYTDTAKEFELGLAATVLALKETGLNYSSPLSRLVQKQKSDGSFSDSPVQGTAYALMALKVAGHPGASQAVKYLTSTFGYSGLGGWKESDGVEYSEVTGEAAHALSKFISE